ncbi:MAG: hypothetical protein UW24_C0001G0051 [Parcubacteria group bacterium GW2011_GWA2_44_12]|nr:MAG: hypothetical protein UW24_C0001G0051 [Parcubacteria group bacterium GW2011_GWA2_44_12]
MNEHTNTTAEADKPLSFDVSEERVTGFLLWAGAISVLLGGVLFVLSDTLSGVSGVAVILVPMVILNMVGAYFWYTQGFNDVARVFIFVGALLFPLFLWILFLKLKIYPPGSEDLGLAITLWSTFTYTTLFIIFKTRLFSLLYPFFGLLAYWFILLKFWADDVSAQSIFLALLFFGIMYMVLGYILDSYDDPTNSRFVDIIGIWTLFTSLALLGLQGHHPFFESALLLLSLAFVFMSFPRKADIFFWAGFSFLLYYIFNMIIEYFASALGWPLALFVSGMLTMGGGMGLLKSFNFKLRIELWPNFKVSFAENFRWKTSKEGGIAIEGKKSSPKFLFED